jgi:hypothetical protein
LIGKEALSGIGNFRRGNGVANVDHRGAAPGPI